MLHGAMFCMLICIFISQEIDFQRLHIAIMAVDSALTVELVLLISWGQGTSSSLRAIVDVVPRLGKLSRSAKTEMFSKGH